MNATTFNKSLGMLMAFMLCLGIVSSFGAGRSADDYLHGSGAKYIQGRLQEASIEVEEGLRQFPSNSKLKALAEQLKKMKDQKKQDQGGSGSQSGENPENKEDKKDSTENSENNKQEKEKQAKEQEEKEKEAKEKQAQEKPDADKTPKDSTGKAPSQAKPGELTKEEAERLLNSYQDDEKREHQQMRQKQRRPVDAEKDW